MPVIAMTREMGSRGKDVALGLSESLGVEIVHHEVVEQHLADRLNVRESTVRRYLEGRSNPLERRRMAKKGLALYTAQEIFELAQQGNVLIRGWGATRLLRSVSHVACVRVCAPLDLRVRTLMSRLETDDADRALKEIKANDAAHAKTMRRLFQIEWEDPAQYDLVLNTERVPIESCVELIKQLVNQPSFQETPESQSRLAKLKRVISRSSVQGGAQLEEAELLSDPDRKDTRHQPLKRDERPKTREESDLLF